MSTEIQNTRDELEQLSLPQLQARFREVIGETTRCPNRRFLMRRIEEALAHQEQTHADGEHVIDEPAAEPTSPQADTIEMTGLPTPDEDRSADTIEMPSVTLLDEADESADSIETRSESTPAESGPTADTVEMPSVTLLDEAGPQGDAVEVMDDTAEGSPQAHTLETTITPTAEPASPYPDTVETPAVPAADEDDPSADTLETSGEATQDVDSPTPRQRGRFGSMTIEELQAKYLEVVGRPSGSSHVGYLSWKIREAEKGRITLGPRTPLERSGEPLDVKVLPLRLEAAVIERMDEAWRSRGIRSRMEFLRRAIEHYLTHVGANDAATMSVGAGSD